MPTAESTAADGAISFSIREAVPLAMGTRRFYRLVATMAQ